MCRRSSFTTPSSTSAVRGSPEDKTRASSESNTRTGNQPLRASVNRSRSPRRTASAKAPGGHSNADPRMTMRLLVAESGTSRREPLPKTGSAEGTIRTRGARLASKRNIRARTDTAWVRASRACAAYAHRRDPR
jgi:hypothetical protein